MFYVRIGTRKKFRQLVYIRKKQNIFLTSFVLRHILKACSNVAEASASRWTKMLIDRRKVSWPMETRAPPELWAFVTSGIQCDRKRIFFIWIRRNPLKSPDSTKEIQALFLGLSWISLHEFGRRAGRLASPVRLIELGAKRRSTRSIQAARLIAKSSPASNLRLTRRIWRAAP
jgi:hypothetical protein